MQLRLAAVISSSPKKLKKDKEKGEPKAPLFYCGMDKIIRLFHRYIYETQIHYLCMYFSCAQFDN